MNPINCQQYSFCKEMFEKHSVCRCMNPSNFFLWKKDKNECEYFHIMKKGCIYVKQRMEEKLQRKLENESYDETYIYTTEYKENKDLI